MKSNLSSNLFDIDMNTSYQMGYLETFIHSGKMVVKNIHPNIDRLIKVLEMEIGQQLPRNNNNDMKIK